MTADPGSYVTDEVVEAVHQGFLNPPSVEQVLAAALPLILPRHRTDVLREAARKVRRDADALEGDRIERLAGREIAKGILRMADEAVTDE